MSIASADWLWGRFCDPLILSWYFFPFLLVIVLEIELCFFFSVLFYCLNSLCLDNLKVRLQFSKIFNQFFLYISALIFRKELHMMQWMNPVCFGSNFLQRHLYFIISGLLAVSFVFCKRHLKCKLETRLLIAEWSLCFTTKFTVEVCFILLVDWRNWTYTSHY